MPLAILVLIAVAVLAASLFCIVRGEKLLLQSPRRLLPGFLLLALGGSPPVMCCCGPARRSASITKPHRSVTTRTG